MCVCVYVCVCVCVCVAIYSVYIGHDERLAWERGGAICFFAVKVNVKAADVGAAAAAGGASGTADVVM